MEGIVIKSTGKWCQVLLKDETEYTCAIKGKFRMDGLRSTNPVAVGDIVEIIIEDENEKRGVVKSIHDRKNYIIRKSVNLSKQVHIIASNIDVCWLLVTIKDPYTSLGFIDRVLIMAEAFNVETRLIINKIDTFNTEDIEKAEAIRSTYESIGYKVYKISAETREGLDDVLSEMSGKVNMFTGHSGAGKSTLANLIQPDLELKTAEVSAYHSKGQHTTTFAEMHKLDGGGFLIDTPGVKGFGLIDIEPDNLAHYFPEMFDLLPDCKFNNCRHIKEPGCAVREAYEANEIPSSRYENYLNIFNDMHEDGNYRIDPYK